MTGKEFGVVMLVNAAVAAAVFVTVSLVVPTAPRLVYFLAGALSPQVVRATVNREEK